MTGATLRLAERLRAMTGQEACAFQGRASAGLQLLLEALAPRYPNRILAMPAMLCQSPAAAVLAAGWTPLFVDVDPKTALVPDAEWHKAHALGARVYLLTHLFGNPAPTAALDTLDGFVIEDACQAMGAPVGRFGDAVLLSFGHTKVIDAGHGGAVLGEASLIGKLSVPKGTTGDEDAGQKDFYRRKIAFTDTGDRALLQGLIEDDIPNIALPYDESFSQRILDALGGLDREVARRRERWSYFVKNCPGAPLALSEGAVPWRYVFTMKEFGRPQQEALSRKLRGENINVSNWYLPCHWLIKGEYLATGPLEATESLSDSIFQFWLDDKAPESCAALKRALS